MADPICRWRNSSVKQVVEFNGLFPFCAMERNQARSLVEKRWSIIGGSAFFTTPYQLAAEMGMYYEDDTYLYPRFSSLISYEEALEYMLAWGKKYYAPNPYTKSMSYDQTPVIINNFLVNWVFDHEVALWSEALQAMFTDSIGNTDILVNMINNFTEVSIKDDIISLKPNAPSVPYESTQIDVDAQDKQAFFEFFGTLKSNASSALAMTPDCKLQQIYYGAPGTGKSHIIKDKTEGESVIRTTFHPDSDYSTFVGAYKPTTKEIIMRDLSGHPVKENGITLTEDKIIYEFVDQAFLQAYIQAWKYYADTDETSEPQKQYLIIEEINRGNCAQIFGDLFQLLDRNASGFSDYPINADNDMKKQIAKAFNDLSIAQADRINACYNGKDVISKVLSGEILLLPNNLYIWATMNTSDQSLFPIDSAFKRRWDWQYMPICKGRDENGNELNWKIVADTKEYDWWSFLTKINDHINSTTNSEDKKLGFFFCKPQDGCISSETFVGKVIFYLWNDVFKDFGFEGPIFKDIDGSELSFNKFYKTDDKGMAVVQKDKVELFLNNLGVDSWDISYDESYTTSSAFRFNGGNPDTLGNIAKAVVEKYAIDHPSDSAQSIRDLFVNTCKGIGVAHIVETESEYHLRDGQSSQKRSSQELTMPNGEKIYVSTQWRAKNDDDNFMKFIKIVKDNNWGEITCDLNATEGFDIDSDTAGAGKAEHKETLVAVTVNDERLTADGITQFDLYLNAIKKIGVDKIGPALEAMKYRRKGSPMATKNKVQGVLGSEGYSYVEADGYYFVKGANGYTLVRILEDLNKSLNLNIQIEYR